MTIGPCHIAQLELRLQEHTSLCIHMPASKKTCTHINVIINVNIYFGSKIYIGQCVLLCAKTLQKAASWQQQQQQSLLAKYTMCRGFRKVCKHPVPSIHSSSFCFPFLGTCSCRNCFKQVLAGLQKQSLLRDFLCVTQNWQFHAMPCFPLNFHVDQVRVTGCLYPEERNEHLAGLWPKGHASTRKQDGL